MVDGSGKVGGIGAEWLGVGGGLDTSKISSDEEFDSRLRARMGLNKNKKK